MAHNQKDDKILQNAINKINEVTPTCNYNNNIPTSNTSCNEPDNQLLTSIPSVNIVNEVDFLTLKARVRILATAYFGFVMIDWQLSKLRGHSFWDRE